MEQRFAPRAQLPANILADLDFRAAGAPAALAGALAERFMSDRCSRTYVPVFLLIGATSSTGDALGPFVGWFLQRKGFLGTFVGTLQNPVHAANIHERLAGAWLDVISRGKRPYIIAVDAAVGMAGRITVTQGPLKPGAGVGKKLPPVGRMHIMGGTAAVPFGIWFACLEQTVGMAEVIADGIMTFWDRCRPYSPRFIP